MKDAKMTTPDEIEFTMDELRGIAGWAVMCARRVLPLFEQRAPGDLRPRDAIFAADEFVRTGTRSNALRMAGLAAYKASRSVVDDKAASGAAESATQAVGAAYLHPINSALQVKHILGSAAYAVYAIEVSDQKAGEDFYRWAVNNAPAAVRSVLMRFPSAPPRGGRVGEIMRGLDKELR